MATIKSFSDLEQSKKLAEILQLESADMEYMFLKKDNSMVGRVPFVKDGYEEPDCGYNTVPCWSLAAMINVLPEGIVKNYYVPYLQKENGKYSIAYGDDELLCIADNPVDACVEMILKLRELKKL